MILGAFIVKLKAVADASLPVSHGRLLHAAFLDVVRQADEELSQKLHDSNVKAFTTGMLSFEHSKIFNGKIILNEGQQAEWKVTCLDTDLTNLLSKQILRGQVRIGKGIFEIIEIRGCNVLKGLPHILEMNDIVEYASYLSHNDSLTFKFMTPTAFRYYDFDYPFPRIDLIFGSLAEKWNAFSKEVVFDVAAIKQTAGQYVMPIFWKGESCRVNITERKGITGFIGTFAFSLRQLPEEHKHIMFTLAVFAMYSGVGRLNAQGMGKVKLVLE